MGHEVYYNRAKVKKQEKNGGFLWAVAYGHSRPATRIAAVLNMKNPNLCPLSLFTPILYHIQLWFVKAIFKKIFQDQYQR